MSRDVPASIKARLLREAKRREEEFQILLVRYTGERFLYRLGTSPARERCILKGAALLALWMPDPYRATRDLDFRAAGADDEAAIRELVTSICRAECPEDGLRFDTGSLTVNPIRAEEEYAGHRVRMTAFLGKARIRFQLDLGFGDAVTPQPEEREYPTLIDGLPAPRIRVYPREASIAEKFEAMVKLGRRNSRMKDFHDLWGLSSVFGFEGPMLREAIASCFARRGTPWSVEEPEALRPGFYEDAHLLRTWSDYLGSGAFARQPPADFAAIGERIRGFLGPPREAILEDVPFERNWPAGGPWHRDGRGPEGWEADV